MKIPISTLAVALSAGVAMARPLYGFDPAVRSVVPTSKYSYTDFINDFDLTYEKGMYMDEFHKREAIFNKNRDAVVQQNTMHAQGKSTWHAELNIHADRNDDELKRLRGLKVSMGRRVRDQNTQKLIQRRGVEDLPDSVDWRDQGVVTPVKNQGGCGSCWAFSSTETLESHAAINSANKTLLTLSPQQYVNCVKNPYQCGGTGGCKGATVEVAYNYTKQYGLPLESQVPYAGSDQVCNPSIQPAATLDGYTDLPKNDADELLKAVANLGPVSVSVAASAWSFYSGGIYDGFLGINDYVVDHAVQLVGYGKDGDSYYWLVRNSWGPTWGEEGYIRVARHPGNEPCGEDKKPEDGDCGTGPCACPSPLTYCGTSAILSDSVVPVGARVL